MASNEYHFITNWKLHATCEEVYNVLSDANALKVWWPSVYLDTKVLKEGNEKNIGKQVALYTKGWLPYTLRWNFVVTETNKPFGFTIKANGDFVGRGIWKLTQNGNDCDVNFDWKLDAEKPLLKTFSFLMKPVFSMNHRWAMKKGEASLRLELLRRKTSTPYELKAIPKPPAPTFPHNFTNNHVL